MCLYLGDKNGSLKVYEFDYIVAGPKSRVQSRGRESKVAVAGPMSRSRVQCRGRGSKVAVGENDLGFEVTAE